MKRIAMTLLAAGTSACLVLTAPASAQIELTTNGGFEAGDISGWQDFTGGQFSATTDNPFEGVYAGNVNNTQTGFGATIKQANLGVGLVNPGDEVTISFAARGTLGPGGVLFPEFFSELSGGGTSAAEILGGGPIVSLDPDEWQVFNFTATAGPDVSGGVTLQFNAATGAFEGSFANVFIDSASVTIPGDPVIPEPASLALLSLGGLAALARRRRA